MDFAGMVKKQGQGNMANGKAKTGYDTKQFNCAISVKAVDAEKRQVRVLASTADLDRDNERILPTAFKKRLSSFLSNPVILACHQHRLEDGTPSVVGKAENVWIDNAGLWCIIKFAETPLAEQYWQLYRDGFMKAVSIGFAPIAFRDTNESGKSVRIFSEVELFEISLVAVPANPNALSKSQQRKADWLEEKKLLKNPDIQKHSEEFAAALLGYKIIDGELVEADEFDYGCKDVEADEFDIDTMNSDNSESTAILAKAVNPDYDYEENPLVRLVKSKQQ